MAAIGRPLLSRYWVSVTLSSSVSPSAGAASIAEAPPDNSTTSRSPRAFASRARANARCAAIDTGRVGQRVRSAGHEPLADALAVLPHKSVSHRRGGLAGGDDT